jgi:hypothetical protein
MDENKVKAMPVATRVAMLDNMAQLKASYIRQGELMDEMKRALVHAWEKDTDMMVMQAKDLIKLVKLYHKAVEDKAETFAFGGATVLTDYAKYLIEYLETRVYLDEMDRITLRKLRREHASKLEEANKP